LPIRRVGQVRLNERRRFGRHWIDPNIDNMMSNPVRFRSGRISSLSFRAESRNLLLFLKRKYLEMSRLRST
jgi:hypothetical protein